MDRRLFTKAAGVAMIGALAGCTSTGPGSEDDAEGADDDDSATSDEDVTDDSTDADDEGADDDRTGDEQEGDDDQTDDGQDEDDQEADDEQTDDEQDEDQAADDDQADDGQDDDDQSDGSPDDEMSAEISMDSELEEFLDVVHHEFSWESGEGSHLCNIDLEVQNASADDQIQVEAIGEIVAEDGAVLAGDRTRFLLDPEETGTFTFSMDQCADATGYQLTFNSEYVPTDSE